MEVFFVFENKNQISKKLVEYELKMSKANIAISKRIVEQHSSNNEEQRNNINNE